MAEANSAPCYMAIYGCAVKLSGGEIAGDGQPPVKVDADSPAVLIVTTHYPGLGEKGSLGWKIFHVLETAAKIGQLASDTPKDRVSGKSIVDFHEAEKLVRGLLPSELRPPSEGPEGVRAEQFRLMLEEAAILKIDPMAPKKGQPAKLRDNLRKKHPHKFANWKGIWASATKAGVFKPVK